jgi:hypothetical protein
MLARFAATMGAPRGGRLRIDVAYRSAPSALTASRVPGPGSPGRDGTGWRRPRLMIRLRLEEGEIDRRLVPAQPFHPEDDSMTKFVARYRPRIAAVLSGFDRLVFRGTLLPLVMPGGMFCFLQRAHVGLLDFKDYVRATSERLTAVVLREAIEHDRPVRYLDSSRTDKETLARQLLAEHALDEGLICAFTTVEPCMSFEYHRSADPHERGLRLRPRKCLHVYKYYRHRVFGFLGTRLQTWFPFNVQLWLNGREWLAHQLERRVTRTSGATTSASPGSGTPPARNG